jgi:hypothetical protein
VHHCMAVAQTAITTCMEHSGAQWPQLEEDDANVGAASCCSWGDARWKVEGGGGKVKGEG